MKIFLDNNFQILKIEDELKDAVVKGSNDFDAMSIFVPTELQTGFYSIYPSYSVRRADNREIGPYAITTNDDTEDGYYGWKAYLKQRDIAVKGPLEITISFVVQKESTSAQIKKNVAKITCNVNDAVEADTDVLIINQEGVESLIDSINEFMTAFSTKADRNNAQQIIIAGILNTEKVFTDTINPTDDGHDLIIGNSNSATYNSSTKYFEDKIDHSVTRGDEAESIIRQESEIIRLEAVTYDGGEVATDSKLDVAENGITISSNGNEISLDELGAYLNDDRVLTELADGIGIIKLDDSLNDGVLTAAQIKEFNKPMCFILYDSNWFYKDYDDESGEVIYQIVQLDNATNESVDITKEIIHFDTSNYSWYWSHVSWESYISSYIDDELALKVAYADIIDNLLSTASNKVLSAKQGKVLKGFIDTLQSEVDGINAGQNLADIVADLTALNTLDTSKLQVNDKVQVLVDSNHDNASTVYNWTGSAWSYIGKYGQDSYSKAETNALLGEKQDVIDANNKLNIDLVQDRFSALQHFVKAYVIELDDYNIRQSNQNIPITADDAEKLNTLGCVIDIAELDGTESIWKLEKAEAGNNDSIIFTWVNADEYFTFTIPNLLMSQTATVTKIAKRHSFSPQYPLHFGSGANANKLYSEATPFLEFQDEQSIGYADVAKMINGSTIVIETYVYTVYSTNFTNNTVTKTLYGFEMESNTTPMTTASRLTIVANTQTQTITSITSKNNFLQEMLITGTGINIAPDGKTISVKESYITGQFLTDAEMTTLLSEVFD